MSTPPAPVAAVLHAVADMLGRPDARSATRRALCNGAGPEVFGLVYEAARQTHGLPAIHHLEQRLRVGQLQQWAESDPATVIAALREAAGTPPEADVEVQTLRQYLAQLGDALVEATGYPGYWPVEQLVAQAGGELSRLREENEKLRAELDATRKAGCTPAAGL